MNILIFLSAAVSYSYILLSIHRVTKMQSEEYTTETVSRMKETEKKLKSGELT